MIKWNNLTSTVGITKYNSYDLRLMYKIGHLVLKQSRKKNQYPVKYCSFTQKILSIFVLFNLRLNSMFHAKIGAIFVWRFHIYFKIFINIMRYSLHWCTHRISFDVHYSNHLLCSEVMIKMNMFLSTNWTLFCTLILQFSLIYGQSNTKIFILV